MKNKDLPAMPTPYAEITNCMGGKDELYCDSTGLTKREYYAAHAPDMPDEWLLLKEQYGQPNNIVERIKCRASALVEWRWHYADMMLEGE